MMDPIRWVGDSDSRILAVRSTSTTNVCISPLPPADLVPVHNNEGTAGNDTPTLIHNYDSKRDATKLASIYGYIPYGDEKPGGMRRLTGYKRECVCAYDVETSLDGEEIGGFPLPSARMLSLCVACTCGTGREFTGESKHISESFLSWVLDHQPRWMIGWNNYLYDNQTILFHGSAWRKYSSVVRVSAAGSVGYGILFDIQGTYNVDAYIYVFRSRASQFSSYSLGGVAEQLGTTPKLEMPSVRGAVDIKALLEYNMNDCIVTLDIWKRLDIDRELISLCLCASCSVYDACRYVTGTMMMCLISSYSLANGLTIKWNPCQSKYEFEGGYVLKPMRGIHKNLYVCDFNSMYPSIMIGCNISPELITIGESDSLGTPEISWDEEHISIPLGDCVARFPLKGDGLLRRIIKDLVGERSKFKRTDTYYSTSLKVCANSIYGAVGFESSPLYSPRCAAAVTTCARWALRKAIRYFERTGLKVVGGDTDSCFVCSENVSDDYETVLGKVSASLSELHADLRGSPFGGLNMELEEHFVSALLLEKKRYCKMKEDGSMKITGMTFARRSESSMRKSACKETCLAVLESADKVDACNRVKEVVLYHKSKVLSMRVPASYICALKSKDGQKKYTYLSTSGEAISLSSDSGDNLVTDYDPHKVLEELSREVASITKAAGLGTVRDVFLASSTL
ncbi:hypothetical protein GGR52DRAFT_256433 [Hypoxylon sp. FL1284]|nr:hypothetical protein GGR52DRAFT_256433 [Hypoxylon sp. FL1284]